MSDDLMNLEAVRPGRRRRYTPDQKRALLDHSAKPGGSISETARTFGVAPSLLFQWKRVMDDATKKFRRLHANCCGSGYVIAASSAELIRPQLA
jgi:transposase